ncbi:unnamed protein product [Durusdinium trenchii]|uniref:Uncharacterized protein n=1 Tax=Durusdinium trenchii TaxID=1381693 RepID=A0ABP0MD23_9DINO
MAMRTASSMRSALHPRQSRGYEPYVTRSSTGPRAAEVAGADAAATSLFTCGSLNDWLRPEAAPFQGLHLKRCITWPNYQVEIDRCQRDFGVEAQIERTVFSKQVGWTDIPRAADEILRGVTLPEDLLSTIRADMCELGITVASLCPWSKSIIVKLELMGEHSCPRWHRDNYCGRGIVTYNLAGTEYATDDIVDFWELENCGNNDHIIRDVSKVRQVNVGDMLFIKGNQFPGGSGGAGSQVTPSSIL